MYKIFFYPSTVSFQLTKADVYPDVMSDMKGYNYTIATLQYFPFVWKRNGEYDGIEIDLTKFLARRFNFKYSMNISKTFWGN